MLPFDFEHFVDDSCSIEEQRIQIEPPTPPPPSSFTSDDSGYHHQLSYCELLPASTNQLPAIQYTDPTISPNVHKPYHINPASYAPSRQDSLTDDVELNSLPVDIAHDSNSSSNVKPSRGFSFISKLWYIVNDPATDDVIRWARCGSWFGIRDDDIFAKTILPKHFRHNKMTSFIRQLNLYGFRKVVHTRTRTVNSEDPLGWNRLSRVIAATDPSKTAYVIVDGFSHPYFVKGGEHLISQITRRISSSGGSNTSSSGNPYSNSYFTPGQSSLPVHVNADNDFCTNTLRSSYNGNHSVSTVCQDSTNFNSSNNSDNSPKLDWNEGQRVNPSSSPPANLINNNTIRRCPGVPFNYSNRITAQHFEMIKKHNQSIDDLYRKFEILSNQQEIQCQDMEKMRITIMALAKAVTDMNDKFNKQQQIIQQLLSFLANNMMPPTASNRFQEQTDAVIGSPANIVECGWISPSDYTRQHPPLMIECGGQQGSQHLSFQNNAGSDGEENGGDSVVDDIARTTMNNENKKKRRCIDEGNNSTDALNAILLSRDRL